MSIFELVLLFIVSLVFGLLMGSTGIGGVFVVPYLVFINNISTQTAIASAMFGFIFAGFSATLAYSKHGSIKWRDALIIGGAAAPAAFFGAITVWVVAGEILLVGIATLTIFSAFKILYPSNRGIPDQKEIPSTVLILIGLITGYFSALAGAGGAIIAIPLLFSFGAPPLVAIGLSQTIALVVAITATLGNYAVGQINFAAGTIVGLSLATGILIGARIAHALPINILRNMVAVALALVGISIFTQLLYKALVL